MFRNRFFLVVLCAFAFGTGAFAEDDFPEVLDAMTAQQQTANYSCLGQCTLRYQDRGTGAVDSVVLDVGPATVTVGTPSEDAIHAAAQVALTPKCPAACDNALPGGRRQLSCRLSGTGPCSRVYR